MCAGVRATLTPDGVSVIRVPITLGRERAKYCSGSCLWVLFCVAARPSHSCTGQEVHDARVLGPKILLRLYRKFNFRRLLPNGAFSGLRQRKMRLQVARGSCGLHTRLTNAKKPGGWGAGLLDAHITIGLRARGGTARHFRPLDINNVTSAT